MQTRDEQLIYQAIESMTGTLQQGHSRKELLLSRVQARMKELRLVEAQEYLSRIKTDEAEKKKFISVVTIHTTSWFREVPHFTFLKQVLASWTREQGIFRLWSAACSVGPEVWSCGLVLEAHRLKTPGFEYELFGSDIDGESVKEAERCIYDVLEKANIPSEYHPLLLVGSGKTLGKMTLHPEIRRRAKFKPLSLLDVAGLEKEFFDLIFCRNVLIYFDAAKIDAITTGLCAHLTEGGHLITGHSETLTQLPKGIRKVSLSVYQRPARVVLANKPLATRLVGLVVDDSAVVQKVLRKQLEEKYDVICANSAAQADEVLSQRSVDFITLDLSMPGEDGASWLKRFRITNKKTPVIVVSDYGEKEADRIFSFLREGAQDFLVKSSLGEGQSRKLLETLEGLCDNKTSTLSRPPDIAAQTLPARVDVIVIGASTGGPQILATLLRSLPASCPPIVVVQHIYSSFAASFARQLIAASTLKAGRIGTEGAVLQTGHVYMADGDYHLRFRRDATRLCLERSLADPVHGQRPAVDELFSSLAILTEAKGLAFLMTGMGKDGAEGLLQLKRTNRFLTVAQNPQTCVVYGMPRQAVQLGAAIAEGEPESMRQAILTVAKSKD